MYYNEDTEVVTGILKERENIKSLEPILVTKIDSIMEESLAQELDFKFIRQNFFEDPNEMHT